MNKIPEGHHVHAPAAGHRVTITELPERPIVRRTTSGKWQVIARAGKRTRVKVGGKPKEESKD